MHGEAMNYSFDKIDDYLDEVGFLMYSLPRQAILDIAHAIQTTCQYDRTTYILGLAGSASTAAHFGADLQRRVVGLKRPIQVYVLTYQYTLAEVATHAHTWRSAFAKQLVGLIKPGDLVIAINGGVWPRNLTRLLDNTSAQGAVTVSLAGNAGGRLLSHVDHCIVVPSTRIDHVESVHLTLCSLIGDVVQTALAYEEQSHAAGLVDSMSCQPAFGIP